MREFILLCVLLLAGCAEDVTVPVAVCPEPVVYSEKEQRDAAAELRALGAENRAPTLRRWIVDYGQLRAKVRECHEPLPE
jgi:hypothetical protein